LSNKDFAKQMVNWIVNVDIPHTREHPSVAAPSHRDKIYQTVAGLTKDNKLSSTKAKELIIVLLGADQLPEDIEQYAQENGYIQVSDQATVNTLVADVIKQNPQVVNDIKNGQTKAIGFLVGQIMKASSGKVNPRLAEQLIKEQIGA